MTNAESLARVYIYIYIYIDNFTKQVIKNSSLLKLGFVNIQKLYIKYRNFKDGLFKNLTYLKSTIFENKLDLRIICPFCVLKRGREYINEIKN